MNVGANHKVVGLALGFFSLRKSYSRRLVSGLQRGRRQCKPNHDIDIRRIPDLALATAFVDTGAYLRSTGVLTAVDGVATGRVNSEIERLVMAPENGIIEGTKPLRRIASIRICWEPFGGPFCNAYDLSMKAEINWAMSK